MDKTFIIAGSSNKPITIDLISANTEEEKSLVIFVHGFKGFKDWGTHQLVGEYFADQGFHFLKFNFSHNGISANSGDVFDDLEAFAKNTFSKEIFDLNQVITFALSGEKFAKPKSLYLIGHSLGGAISIIQSSEDKAINKLATWASISSFRNLWSPEQEIEWRKNGVLYFMNSRTKVQMPIYSSLLDDLSEHTEKLDILSAARSISQPWLIIHGEDDPGVSPKHAYELHVQQTQSELVIIPGADHVFGAKHPWEKEQLPHALKLACDTTINFFKKQ